MLATMTLFPARVSHLPLVPFIAALPVISEIFFVAKSIVQRRSSQLKIADEPFVFIQRFGVPKLEVPKFFIANLGAITAVRI
jgi:hypothetical protein